ncbi:hypothetical protein [Candidatus Poriferisocius sp.]|uniref:hypothetical protein n=1 Tax=Candidatus Poriferisocius sp. TaxID=3101276 RepID=UPI003B5B8566
MSDHAPPHRSGPADTAEQPAENLTLSEPGAYMHTPQTVARSKTELWRNLSISWLLYGAVAGSAIYARKWGVPLWLTLLVALGVCAVLAGFGIQRERKRRGKRRGQGFNPFS